MFHVEQFGVGRKGGLLPLPGFPVGGAKEEALSAVPLVVSQVLLTSAKEVSGMKSREETSRDVCEANSTEDRLGDTRAF